MPSPNKLRVLREAGYRVRPSCLRCRHFVQGGNLWGSCLVNMYEHEKHTAHPRLASVTQDGLCDKFEAEAGFPDTLGAHSEFVTEREEK